MVTRIPSLFAWYAPPGPALGETGIGPVVRERALTVRQLRRSGQPRSGPDPDVVTAVTRSADLLREGRELLLDLVDRAEVRDAAAAWTGRVNTVTARTDRVDVDAMLIRPDSCVAWVLPTG